MADRAPTAIADRASARLRLFGTGLVATVVASALALPWRLAGIAFAALTIYAGLRHLGDLVALRRAGRPAPGWLGVAVGVSMSVLVLLVLAGEAALYPIVAEAERCTEIALTHADRKACTDELTNSQNELLRRLQPAQR